MSGVKRYDCNGMECSAGYSHMRFVLASDYDALAQRCRELDEALQVTGDIADARGERVEQRITEVADLKAKLLDAERGAEELVRLRAERRELEKDAARLDWLAERIEDMVIDGADPCLHATDEEESWPVLWRRAIDAVRKRDGAPE